MKAAFILGSTRTGALIVIEQKYSLQEYIETGIEVDAVVTNADPGPRWREFLEEQKVRLVC